MLLPEFDQREHDKGGDQKIDARARSCDQERMVATHIPGVRLERKSFARDKFDQESGGSEDPYEIVDVCIRVVGLKAAGDQQNGYRAGNVVESVRHGMA